MKTYHAITVTLLIEQANADVDGTDADIARDLASKAVAGICPLIESVSGRGARVKAITVEPLRVLMSEHNQRQEHPPA